MADTSPRHAVRTAPGTRVAALPYVGLFAVAVILPVAIAAASGALDIPRSDDWSYLLTLFRLLDHGRLGFNNWVSMTLVGQIALAAPVAALTGNSITAVHVFGAVVGYAGLVALVHCVPGDRRAPVWVLAFAIALGPLWAPLAPTFMTDVPALAAQCCFLALAIAALRAPRLTLARCACTLAVGFLAIAIRQYEAIPVIAFAIVATARAVHDRDRSEVRAVATATAVAAIATAALFAWWLSLPDSLSLAPSPVTSGVVANLAVRLGGFARLAGLLLLPVVVAARPVRLTREAWRSSPPLTALVGAGTAVWMLATYARVPDVPFVGNYVDRFGVLSRDVTFGPRSLVMPASLFDVLAVLGSIAAIVLAMACVAPTVGFARRVRSRELAGTDPIVAMLVLSLVGFATAYGFAIATSLPVFDRYLLPILPIAGLLLAGRVSAGPSRRVEGRDGGGRSAAVGVGAALVVLTIVGLVFATDSASFDGARWRLDRKLVHMGYAPKDIYGGFEWISWHARTGPPQGDTAAERQRLRARYLAPFCIGLVVGPGPKSSENAVAGTQFTGLGHGAQRIVAVRKDRPCRGRVSRAP